MRAAIIIGSNSLRMLLDTKPQKKRFRQQTGLFTKLNNKRISREDALSLAEYINKFIETASSFGADSFFLGATSAVRDAKNQEEVRLLIRQTTGLSAAVLTGAQEAELSFMGAADSLLKCGVVDIGGGSTEIATGENGKIIKNASFQIGAARLYKKAQINSASDIDFAICEAAKAFKDADFDADKWYFAGGTAAILAHMINKESYSAALKDTEINFGDIKKALEFLADTPRELRSKIPAVPKGREDILPTGAAILLSLMQKYDINKLTATERSNLDGALKAEALGKIKFSPLHR